MSPDAIGPLLQTYNTAADVTTNATPSKTPERKKKREGAPLIEEIEAAAPAVTPEPSKKKSKKDKSVATPTPAAVEAEETEAAGVTPEPSKKKSKKEKSTATPTPAAVEAEEEATEEKVGLSLVEFLTFCMCGSEVAMVGLKCIVRGSHSERYTSGCGFLMHALVIA